MQRWLDHTVMLAGCVIMGGPLLLVFLFAARPGGLRFSRDAEIGLDGLSGNVEQLRSLTGNASAPSVEAMILTSLSVALGVAVVTTLVSFLAAFAMVFTERRATRVLFWVTLATLYFPIEARMLPTFDIAARLGLIDTLAGLVLPILPLALATLVLRQHLKMIPPEYAEAARLDGAGPLRFLVDMALPLSLVPMAAVALITFMIGWNQYLWPLLISVENTHFPLMRGLNLLGSGSGAGLVLAAISILPPLVLVVAFLRLLPRVTAIRM